MKVGILTFHRSDNYGSALQACALKYYINGIEGYDCKVIDYQPAVQKEFYSVYLKPTSIKNIVKNFRAFLYRTLLKDRKRGFESFQQGFLDGGISSITDEKVIEKELEKYDIIVCGSDQIWNPHSFDFSMEYFAPTYSGKKIAYAPSSKKAIVDDYSNPTLVGDAIRSFSHLSVRERNGKELIKQLTGRDAKVVLDPTLLLDQEDYLQFESEYKPDEPYIFFYSIDYNPQVVKMVELISKMTKLQVIVIFSSNKTFSVVKSSFKLTKHSAPGDFLSLIKNADLVLTNSFHGTAFSVIYRKRFFALKPVVDGNLFVDVRINELLENIHLEDRYLSYGEITGSIIDQPINFDETLILQKRKESMDYLINALDH